jgi:hypothetical protein
MRSNNILTTQRNDFGARQVRTAVVGNDGLRALASAGAIFKRAYQAAKRLASSTERRVSPVVAGSAPVVGRAITALHVTGSPSCWHSHALRMPQVSGCSA